MVKKNLFSKVLAGVLAAGMVVTMLPGMSMTAKADSGEMDFYQVGVKSAVIKLYPETDVATQLKTPWALPNMSFDAATPDTVDVSEDVKFVIVPNDYWEYDPYPEGDGPRPTVQPSGSSVAASAGVYGAGADIWTSKWPGGNGVTIEKNGEDASGRSYIVTYKSEYFKQTGNELIRLEVPQAPLLKVTITANANGVDVSEDSPVPASNDDVFTQRVWTVSFDPDRNEYLIGKDGSTTRTIQKKGVALEASYGYNSEIVLYGRKPSSSAGDFEMTVGTDHTYDKALANAVNYRSHNFVDILGAAGYQAPLKNLTGETAARDGFTLSGITDTTSYVGVYNINNRYVQDVAAFPPIASNVLIKGETPGAGQVVANWLSKSTTYATRKNLSAVHKSQLPKEIEENIFVTLNPEDIYDYYVFGVANGDGNAAPGTWEETDTPIGFDANNQITADDKGTNKRQKAVGGNPALRYTATKNLVINFGSGKAKPAKIKIQNGDQLTSNDLSVANLYRYEYVIRDAKGNRFDAQETLVNTYRGRTLVTADPVEYPYDKDVTVSELGDPMSGFTLGEPDTDSPYHESHRWYNGTDEVYFDTYYEGDVFEFTVKVDPLFDGSNMKVHAYGNDDRAKGAGPIDVVVPYDETTGTYKFTIGKDGPYRIVVLGVERKATGIVRNIYEDKDDPAVYEMSHKENLSWLNRFYEYRNIGAFAGMNCNIANPKYQFFMAAHEEDNVLFDLVSFAVPGAVGSGVDWNGHEFPAGEYKFKMRFNNAWVNATTAADGDYVHGQFNDDITDDRYAEGPDFKVTYDGQTLTKDDNGLYTIKVEADKKHDLRVEGVVRAYKVLAPNLAAYDIDANWEMQRTDDNNFVSSVPEGQTYRFKLNPSEGTQKGPDFKVMLRATNDDMDNTNNFVPTEIKEDAEGYYSFTVNNDTEIFIYGLTGTGFSDVANRTAEEQEAINWLKDQGVINGYDDGSFRPGTSTTRAEFVKMLFELKKGTAGTASFSDTASHWAAGQIGWGAAQSIVNGYPDGSFKPNQSITRAEVAQVIWKLAGNQGTSFKANFPDVAQNMWYAPAVNWNFEKGIVKGYENGNFGPNDPIERAHMALILYRSYGQF